jgi:serine/threonine protein kinase
MSEESILLEALQQPVEDRAAYLDGACGTDPALRESVELLLRAHEKAGDFMQGNAAAQVATISQPAVTEKPGDRIGPYKLLQKVGEGGFGVVYMAEQTEPVRRKVALKVIKPGMDTNEVIARFEAERQALALLDHPNIAKVLDAGATPRGRPYFVMELVKGIPLVEFCDSNSLDAHQRLELFVTICRAVQHAHHKGIIHRDLKPSNVMVTLIDNKPVPKVIDFGVSKAISQQLTEKTLFTAYGQMVGTPVYMSPEQAQMSGLDVDTRSDIYSLGVLLYELLTGSTPLNVKQLRGTAYAEVQRLICEQEPPKPSTRLSTQGDLLPQIAKHRCIEPRKLTQLLRGDLDWIVMKSLEKERNHRYDTANSFAADIERFLGDEAVEARPPSIGYKFRKFARRNRALLATAATIALVLVAATIVSTSLAVWAVKQRQIADMQRDQKEKALDEAEAARASEAEQRILVEGQRDRAQQAEQRADRERQQAEVETVKAKQAAQLLTEMVGAANPAANKGPDYTILEMLDDFSADLDERLVDQPEIKADIRSAIGQAYWELRLKDKAQQEFQKALAMRQEVFGEMHVKVAASLVDLSRSALQFGRNDEQEELASRAFTIHQQLGLPSLEMASAMRWMGIAKRMQGEHEVASDRLRQAIQIARQAAGGGESRVLALAMHDLSAALTGQGQLDEAVHMAREAALMHRRVHGPKHPETAYGYIWLSRALIAQGDLVSAVEAAEQALAIREAIYAPGHKVLVGTYAFLVHKYVALERWEDALAIAQRRTQVTENFHADIDLAYLHTRLDDWASHKKLYSEWLAAEDQTRPPISYAGMAMPYLLHMPNQSTSNQSDKLLDQAAKVFQDRETNNPWYKMGRGLAAYRLGKWEEALVSLDEALRKHDKPSNTTVTLCLKAMAIYRQGDVNEAKQLLGQAKETYDTILTNAEFPGDWRAVVGAQVAMKEAQTLILGDTDAQ